MSKTIKDADNTIMVTECRDLMRPPISISDLGLIEVVPVFIPRIWPEYPAQSEYLFLSAFDRINHGETI
jgi:hypothetical protein